MSEGESASALIGKLKQKSFDVANRSTDVIVPVIVKAFDAMAAMIDSETNQEHIQRALRSFNNERTLSVSYDHSSDPIRGLMFDVLEGIHRTLQCVAEKMSGDQMEVTESSPHPGETIDSVEFILDNLKVELPEDSQVDIGIRPVSVLSEPLNNYDIDESYEMVEMKEEEMEMEEETDECSINNQTEPMIAMSDTSSVSNEKRVKKGENEKNRKEKKEKRSSGLKLKETIMDKSPMKCPACEWVGYKPVNILKHCRDKHSSTSTEMGFYFRSECGNASRTDSHIKCSKCKTRKFELIRDRDEPFDANRSVVSESPMKCPKCEYTGYHPSAVEKHFRVKHASSPLQMGVAFRCKCGHVARSKAHVESACNQLTFELVRDEPSMGANEEKEKKESDDSPQFVIKN